MQRLSSIIWGQCSKATRAKLRGIKGFNKTEEEKDSTTILHEIKDVAYKYNGHRNLYLVLDNSKTK